MNKIIQKKMEQFKADNHARNAWLTAEEWSKMIGETITPQRLGAMWKAGLVIKHDGGRQYWGDSKNRYDVKYSYTE